MSSTPAFEFNDLQGIFRFAHGQLPAACFQLLKIRDAGRARQWLKQAPVTSAETRQPPPDTALQVAFTANGLRCLGLDPAVISGFSAPFLSGMTEPARSRRLGDTGDNSPQNWRWGGSRETVPDLLVMLYAREGALASWEADTTDTVFSDAFVLLGRLETSPDLHREPFGFVDGISQPKIDWNGTQSSNPHDRSAFSNLLAPGELVLGYPNEYGEYTDRPLLGPGDRAGLHRLPVADDQPGMRDLGRNGGYLAFRQLEQDVHGFWQCIDRYVDGDPVGREQLAARMVGRRRDGQPLVDTAPALGDDSARSPDQNKFNYDGDPVGRQCPIGAHIRRSNPRTGDMPPGGARLLRRLKQTFGFDSATRDQDLVAATRFHRLLRRGRPYGSTVTPEAAVANHADGGNRGIHFISLGANLSRQFEFVQSAWLASPKFGGLEQESDPLVGNRMALAGRTPTNHFTAAIDGGPRQRIRDLPQFVTVRGGAYFFMPGLRALDYLAHMEGTES